LITYFPGLFCIFGPNYIAAKEIISIGFGTRFCAFGSAPVYLNMTGGNEFFNVLSWLLLALILSNYWLIPSYGMIGWDNFFGVFCGWNSSFIVLQDGIKLF
jgi:hypothetical protein